MLPKVPVLFQTGYDLNSTDSEYFLNEGLTSLQKPYAIQDLPRNVREMLA